MIAFYLFAAVTLGAALLVIGQRNPMYSVLLLIAAFGGLAGLYVLLDAPFVAVIQIIVYAGAIMVLFLFVVMLLAAPVEEAPRGGAGAARWWGVALAAALGVVPRWFVFLQPVGFLV
ncbi:MAG TPA: NADH-quinone oxidoreductase subunit J, partial [Vicinamibacterales bacterium]|nr:NADH-quinone oxidoreductase subunit J [Vicinamibacterales bacterium]